MRLTRADTANKVAFGRAKPRPHDVPDGFGAEGDTWYFPRVAGTFKERAGWHGWQMPK
jgi:site-specific DNA-methyltransferase (adenine-specific)